MKTAAIAGVVTLIGVAGLALVARPQFDPYGWLLWGREIVNTSGFSTTDYPSWKPLGALLATPVALTGSAAPAVWLVVERAITLVGVLFAYLLGTRLAGSRLGGILAAGGVVLISGWLGETFDGHLEPAVATLLLAGFWFDSEDRPIAAFAALTGAALARPDAWLALMAYGVIVWRRGGGARILVAAVALLVPLLWFGGDILGSGSAFRGSNLAREATTSVTTRIQNSPALYALNMVVQAPLAVLGACALLAFVSPERRRDRTWVFMGLVVLSWIAVDVAMAADGYPADPRYVIPEAVLVTVLGGAALARFTLAAWERARARPQRTAVALAVIAALVLSAAPALSTVRSDVRLARTYSRNVASLATVSARLRRDGLLSCHPSIEQTYQAPMAWYLHRQVAQVKHPTPDGLALTDRTAAWIHLTRLEARQLRYGGLKIRRLAGEGVWQPELLEPRRPKRDAKGVAARACDRTTART